MVYILLADGFEEIEALSPVDALRRGGVEAATVGVTGHIVTGSHGIQVVSDIDLSEIDINDCEAIVVPGGLRGVQNIRASHEAMAAVKAVYEAGGIVSAICAGPTALAELHITDGKRAVCYPGMEDEMGAADMQIGAAAVTDGRVITSRSAGTAWDFAFALLTALRGAECAKKVAKGIHYDHLQG